MRATGHSSNAKLALLILRRRWCWEVLSELESGREHFLALQRRLPGLAHKVLTDQLRFLQRTGVVRRSATAGRSKVFYELSPEGRALVSAARHLEHWAPPESAAGVLVKPR